MAIVLRVKHNQIEPKITGLLFQNTYYVDDRMVDGLKLGFFTHVTDAGQSIGEVAPTLVHANAKAGRKATGFVYDASKRSEYASANNMNSNTRLFPYGFRQDQATGLLKYGVIEISDTESTKHRQFSSVREEVLASELKLLQKVEIAKVVSFVCDISENGEVITLTTDGIATTTVAPTVTVTRLGQMEDAIYLAGWEESNVKPGTVNAMAIPFPFVTWPTGQVVGYIESPIAVRIDLRHEFAASSELVANAVSLVESGEQYGYESSTSETNFKLNEVAPWINAEESAPIKIATRATVKKTEKK